jgi:hypothetical protein
LAAGVDVCSGAAEKIRWKELAQPSCKKGLASLEVRDPLGLDVREMIDAQIDKEGGAAKRDRTTPV